MFGTMSIGGVLDVAIGLMFIYFLLAQVATGLQEVIAGWFAWRGSYLTKSVDVLMSNDNGAAFSFLKDFVTTHFLPGAPPTHAETAVKGSPIQGGVAGLTEDQTLIKLQDVMRHPLMRGNPSANPSYIPAQKFAMALLDLLRNGSQAPLFTQAEATVKILPDGQLKNTLSVFIRDAGGDVDKLRTHIENWFDDAMDELSAIYKRLSRFAMLLLGLIIAVSVNVDSIRVAKFLWASPAAASDLADAAQQAKNDNCKDAPCQEAAGQAALTKLRGFKLPIGWDFNVPTPPGDSKVQSDDDACTKMLTDKDYNQRLADVQQCHGLVAQNLPGNWNRIVLIAKQLPGWLITAIAVSLGAPFWFGLMQNLLNLRSDAKPPRADAKQTPAPKTS